MGKLFDRIIPELAEFIYRQKMFFVATAPLSAEGHINLSPKGLDSLRILDEHTVAYVDLVGSGIETVAHTAENGRIVLMFCSFEGAPKILRLHGRGETVTPRDAEFSQLATLFPNYLGTRAIIRVHCERISDSCGYGVPLYSYEGERTQMLDWCERKGPDGLRQYQIDKNAQSIDGLPGISVG